MKKKFTYFVAAVCAALTFSACSSDKLEAYSGQTLENPESPSNAISFGTYMGKTSTRSTVGTKGGINTTKLQTTGSGNGFGVFAYYTGNNTWASAGSSTAPNFMYNQNVYYNTTDWTYTPVKYWPNDNTTADGSGAVGTTTSKISFFAYAPYVATAGNSSSDDGIVGITSNATNGDPKITYKLPTLPTDANTVDLLWGMNGKASYDEADGTASTSIDIGTGYNVDLTKQHVTEKVNFLFKHALAKLGGSKTTANKGGVYVALDLDNIRSTTGDGTNGGSVWDGTNKTTLVTIQSFTIENGVASGLGVLKDGGVFDLATGTWDVSGASDYTFSDAVSGIGTGKLNANIAEEGTISYNTTNKQWEKSGVGLSGVTTTLTEIYDTKDALYFVPTGADQKIKVTIAYKVRTYDGLVSGGFTNIDQTISKVITFSGGFQKNKLYRLNVYLGLTSVKFTASVAAWGDEDGDTEDEVLEVVDLPINVD